MMKEQPPSIYSNIPGTWANSTVSIRLPEIAGRVIRENQYSKKINHNLSQLQTDIHDGTIRHLYDLDTPDLEAWEDYIQPYLDQKWLEVPWFFAEHYFYRRIIEAVQYFQSGQDPFGYQKSLGLTRNRKEIMNLADFLQRYDGNEDQAMKILEKGFYYSLWGNQGDLSLWPADNPDHPTHGSQESLQEHLLANDMQLVLDHLAGGESIHTRLDLMLDNAGFELITDLALADILLGLNLVERIVLHAKAHPTFVSDVIPDDIRESVRFLSALPDPAAQSFGNRLHDYLNSGRMEIQSSLFWNSPLPMWNLPDNLIRDWEGSSLVICKGDANYRRILGDLQWEMTVPFPKIVNYLPTPLLALRTLKAELAVGLDPDGIQYALSQDPNWMVSGRWGVIHFSAG